MKRLKFGLAAVITALVFLGGVAIAPSPASAHNPDPYAYWACSLERSDPSATVIHSEAWALSPGTIHYRCIQDVHFFGVTHGYYVSETPPFSGNTTRESGYQNCQLIACWAH